MFDRKCPNPICKGGKVAVEPCWFPQGPPLSYLPLPIPDKDRPWGGSCTSCSLCCGHYTDPKSAVNIPSTLSVAPPSTVLLNFFNSLKGLKPTQKQLEAVSRQVLLPCSEVELWLNHLTTIQENRKRGAAKAAETRKKQRAERTRRRRVIHWCRMKRLKVRINHGRVVCGEMYKEGTLEEELWIECNIYQLWFHGDCVSINPSKVPKVFNCASCKKT